MRRRNGANRGPGASSTRARSASASGPATTAVTSNSATRALAIHEAMHLLELRTTPQGHPAYRVVGQEMHRLIAERAGHRAIAEMMRFVDHSGEPELERLQAERRAESRRTGAG